MKKVLLITYHFPPIAGAGIQRSLKFVKYLPYYGITPVVFCPQKASWRVMDCHNLTLPYLKKTKIYRFGIKRLERYYCLRYDQKYKTHPYFYLLGLRYIWLMDFIGSWYLECRDKALNVALKEDIDCVITSSPPHSLHLFGKYLKMKLNVSWLMDLRDSMHDNPTSYKSSLLHKLTSYIESKYERRFYKDADAIISVSQPILDSIKHRYSKLFLNDKLKLITNGFDDEDFNIKSVKGIHNNAMVITYTGSFLGNRTPEHFLSALSMLCFRKEIDPRDLLVQFVGQFDENLCAAIQSHSSTFAIKIIEHQPYERTLTYQADSDVLLLINSTAKHQGGDQIYTGKFFEYIGSLRPIFALTPDGPLKETIEKGNFGIVAPPHDIDEIGKQFKRFYDIWKSEKSIPYNPDLELRNTFTHKNTAEKLAGLITNCISNKPKNSNF